MVRVTNNAMMHSTATPPMMIPTRAPRERPDPPIPPLLALAAALVAVCEALVDVRDEAVTLVTRPGTLWLEKVVLVLLVVEVVEVVVDVGVVEVVLVDVDVGVVDVDVGVVLVGVIDEVDVVDDVVLLTTVEPALSIAA